MTQAIHITLQYSCS